MLSSDGASLLKFLNNWALVESVKAEMAFWAEMAVVAAKADQAARNLDQPRLGSNRQPDDVFCAPFKSG